MILCMRKKLNLSLWVIDFSLFLLLGVLRRVQEVAKGLAEIRAELNVQQDVLINVRPHVLLIVLQHVQEIALVHVQRIVLCLQKESYRFFDFEN